MKVLVSALLSLSFGASIAHAIDPNRIPQAQIFLLENLTQKTTCTATIFRPSRFSCALVTNSHCLKSASDRLNLVEIKHSLPSAEKFRNELSQRQDYAVKAIKASSEPDLAELSIPNPLYQAFCGSDGLLVAQPFSAEQAASSFFGLVSLGLKPHQELKTFSGFSQKVLSSVGDLGWPWAGSSQRSLFETGSARWPFAVKVSDLAIYPGMSGGAVIDQYKNFVGLNVWLRGQGLRESYFIATGDIIQFLKSAPKTFEFAETIETGATLPAGGNSHSDGGGGLMGAASSDIAPKLESFLFSPEGIVNPDNSQEIILGVDGQSVDSAMTYHKLMSSSTAHAFIVKPRVADSAPELSVRQGWLQRMMGQNWGFGKAEAFFETAAGSFAETPALRGSPTIALEISGDTLRLRTNQFPWSRPDSSFGLVGFSPDILAEYQIELSSDAKLIFLKPSHEGPSPLNELLVCQNSQFLKLNCKSENSVLSLHKYDARHAMVEVNYAYRIRGKAGSLVHFYGDLRYKGTP